MIEQQSPEWFAARLGRVTASRVADVVARTKSGFAASRASYMAQLIAERLTGTPQESYTSGAMQWGVEMEGAARIAYSLRHDAAVDLAGFVAHPTIAMSGASPDGYVGDEGLLELKCPQTATHLDTLLGGSVPSRYVTQMQWQMACTKRNWCDFASYDPRMPPEMRLFVKRVQRDDAEIQRLEGAVVEFLAELDAKLAGLSHIYGGAPSPLIGQLEGSLAA